MLYEFELGPNATKTTKNNYRVKDESPVDQRTVNRWLKKFRLSDRNLEDQARSGRPTTVDFEAMLQTIEANSVISIRRVSGELGISQVWVVHLHDFLKSIGSCRIVPPITKILQNFWLTQVLFLYRDILGSVSITRNKSDTIIMDKLSVQLKIVSLHPPNIRIF